MIVCTPYHMIYTQAQLTTIRKGDWSSFIETFEMNYVMTSISNSCIPGYRKFFPYTVCRFDGDLQMNTMVKTTLLYTVYQAE